ncbi:uncharacterized protein si:ch211-202f5.3 [Phycodurus eques]|uniref:uncharacterized protein si:ch211-202f5.3 n=1 Tax=Phycodurus eques TaxID=693459 RepID=UPI002ACDE185|nr:uncharacterized protein si:ch211-202f5.3 [Phycodurus eques]XP_061553993.1 uncharacterized protein si:ch211-202f5.3 [Phycodurus eques]
MSSNIHVSLDNPYGRVSIPRAKLRTSADAAAVIANPAALNGNDPDPYPYVAPAPSYLVKDAEEDGGGRYTCCYRCRRRK